MTCATRPSVHRSVSNPNASGPLRNAWSTASSSAADSRGRRPARPAPRSAAWPPWRQRRYQTLAACADTPKVWATSAWLAPWANMWAASRRRCSRPAKSRRQVPTLIGIADLPVRCPCLHTQHAGPKLHYQPIPRSSLACVLSRRRAGLTVDLVGSRVVLAAVWSGGLGGPGGLLPGLGGGLFDRRVAGGGPAAAAPGPAGGAPRGFRRGGR